jgi:hypothetical protein
MSSMSWDRNSHHKPMQMSNRRARDEQAEEEIVGAML